MLVIDRFGNTKFTDKPSKGEFVINLPSTEFDVLKKDWDLYIPDVWEFDLEKAKQAKLKSIDSKTSEVISKGFMFENVTFSLSSNAQQKIMIIQMLLDKDLLDAETPLSTIDDKEYILKKEKAADFVAAAYTRLTSSLVLGTKLKEAVNKASTLEELNNIEDKRQ